MPDLLSPESNHVLDTEEQDQLRRLNRSPHPYHHQHTDLPHLSDKFALQNGTSTSNNTFTKESTPASDSGTEADDEHLLKGLPAPRLRPPKGLRGFNELLSGATTPLASPGITEEDGPIKSEAKNLANSVALKKRATSQDKNFRILVRRAAEVGILGMLGWMVQRNKGVSPVLTPWKPDLQRILLLVSGLLVLYPLRLIYWARRYRPGGKTALIKLPSDFDPAPLLYPPTITLLVAFLISKDYPTVILPNLVLAICSLPQTLVPKLDLDASYDTVHWAISCLPLAWHYGQMASETLRFSHDTRISETLVLLYPLHRTLCAVLYHLTTTSLLTAELQLLSIAMVNILVLAKSPQVQILKALLWVGGLSVLLLCGPVIRWGIMLARVPKWRLQREGTVQHGSVWKKFRKSLSWRKQRNTATTFDTTIEWSSSSAEEDEGSTNAHLTKVHTITPSHTDILSSDGAPAPFDATENCVQRRSTSSSLDRLPKKRKTETASGRRKRATSISIRPYLKLTHWQATARKWLFASYVYSMMPTIILLAVRPYVQFSALDNHEPVGWALGYLFGDLPWFRYQVVYANLERWIILPRRLDNEDKECCLGWVQHIRHDDFGEANTRLLLSSYWLGVVMFGLIVVLQLKSTYEVDTRRKVFHFTMVGMFLPTIYVDPTYAAMALSLVLSIFLILDLLRASQLPPLSRPIASFLAPYVDGRDFRGPVVISHIFLLIGCAIPLWLSLAALPRTGTGSLSGWEVPTRDVSMLAGVICVGLGDAAASLIGRRWGRRKWLWGGGKSLEGSLACAVAVWAGLFAANLWLRIGGWPLSAPDKGILVTARDCGVCATVASLTETVLTGGNDNVIVPIVLWTCVKSLGI